MSLISQETPNCLVKTSFQLLKVLFSQSPLDYNELDLCCVMKRGVKIRNRKSKYFLSLQTENKAHCFGTIICSSDKLIVV